MQCIRRALGHTAIYIGHAKQLQKRKQQQELSDKTQRARKKNVSRNFQLLFRVYGRTVQRHNGARHTTLQQRHEEKKTILVTQYTQIALRDNTNNNNNNHNLQRTGNLQSVDGKRCRPCNARAYAHRAYGVNAALARFDRHMLVSVVAVGKKCSKT